MATSIIEPIKLLICTSIGLLLRIVVAANFKDSLRQRVELTTPLSDRKRTAEAIHLWSSGLDPYAGNIYHEYPVSLQVYKILSNYTSIDLALALTDVITGYLLHRATFKQMIITGHEEQVARSRSRIVLMIYLFSPLTVLSCASQSTAIFTNFLISIICFTLHIEEFRALTCVLCAFLACNNIHYATLTLPIFLAIEFCSSSRQNKSKTNYHQDANFERSLTTSFGIFILSVITLLLASFMLMGNSWLFMKATYFFTLRVQDVTPNIGLTWYFITEMFEPFLEFFTWTVQINAFIHVIPIAICYRDKPFFALYIIMLLATIFQPYPSLAHIGLTTSLLPQFLDLIPHTKHGLKVSCAAVTCLSLMPVFWHLWIMTGTANANFYFGATLAFSASLILLMVDLLNANGFAHAKVILAEIRKEKWHAD